MLALPCVLALALVALQATALPVTPSPDSGAIKRADDADFKARGGHSPVLMYQVDPEFTEAARKKRISGNVTISFVVDRNGKPKDLHVLKGVGLGLDEKAVEAVRQYRFKPATDADGQPVAMPLTVNVNFQIF